MRWGAFLVHDVCAACISQHECALEPSTKPVAFPRLLLLPSVQLIMEPAPVLDLAEMLRRGGFERDEADLEALTRLMLVAHVRPMSSPRTFPLLLLAGCGFPMPATTACLPACALPCRWP